MLFVKLPKTVNIISGLNFIKIEGPLGTVIKDCTEVEIIQKELRLYCILNKNIKNSQTYLALLRSLIFFLFVAILNYKEELNYYS
jgi:ribosomal protein L6P/L9E